MSWIKLHRKSLHNFLYQEDRELTRREAWENMLLLVNSNREPKKIMLGNRIIECGYGQSVRSLKTWANEFKWTVSKVRRFFKLLQDETMIVSESVGISTRITICNYDTYQSEPTRKRHANDTQTTTNNNYKLIDKVIEPPTSFEVVDKFANDHSLKINVLKFYEYYQGKGWPDTVHWKYLISTWKEIDNGTHRQISGNFKRKVPRQEHPIDYTEPSQWRNSIK
jgi:hypothetical protein